MDDFANSPESSGGNPTDWLVHTRFDPSLHSPSVFIEKVAEHGIPFDLLGELSDDAYKKLPIGVDSEESHTKRLTNAYKSFLLSEPDPEIDEVYFYALAPMFVAQLDSTDPVIVSEGMADLLLFVSMPDRESYRGKKLVDAVSQSKTELDDSSKERKSPSMEINSVPEGMERLFVLYRKTHGPEVGMTKEAKELLGQRIMGASELLHLLELGRLTEDGRATRRRQDLLVSVFSGFPREVCDFLLSDPYEDYTDSAGLAMVSAKYSLASAGNKVFINKSATHLEASFMRNIDFGVTPKDDNNRSMQRRLKRALTILVR